MIFSPLKESHGFNKYVKILRVKMTKRVRKTNKSPEDQQESGRPTRVRKTAKGKNKKHGDQRKPTRVRRSPRVKEDCQVPRIQKPKSLEDWHHLRVKPKRMTPPYPLQQEEETERKRKRKTPLNQPLTHIDFP